MVRLSLLFVSGLILISPYLHSQVPPGIPADNELLKLGLLDVTLLGADSTGNSISTQAIRDAVNMARDYNLVCYFPSGTYLVDDTIRCMKKSIFQNDRWRTVNHYCQLVGSAKKRPVIKLVPGAQKFQDPSNPLPVFWLYSMSAWGQQPDCEGDTDPTCGQSNVSFNQVVKSIDIDLSQNPGAVGIRHPGAQGATIEDVNINANGAFAGLYNPPGQAGGTYNVEVEGGKYGIYMTKVKYRYQAKFTIVTGCVFKNQEIATIHIDIPQPVVMVGIHIIQDNGPINVNLPHDGLSLIDCIIELNGGPLIHSTGNSLYLENTFIKGASEVAYGWQITNPDKWTHIKEYSYCRSNNSRNLINGSINTSSFKNKAEDLTLNSDSLVRELLYRHIWDNERFPHFESEGVVNVRDSAQMMGNPAKGDGTTDDYAALQYAVDNFDKVFLPKGNYLISRTLQIKEQTQLFGISRTYTSIKPSTNWNPVNGNALIETVNDTTATTSISSMRLQSSGGHPLVWKAGKASMVRSINPGVVHIVENGGGRWFAISNVHSQLIINGTSQPIAMYATNPERAMDPEYEIINAKNVKIFYLKTEAGTDGHSYMTSLRIRDSEDISVYGGTGNVQLDGSNGLGMIEVINSENVKVVHANPFKTGTNWFIIKEIYANTVNTVSPDLKLALFKRDAPKVGSVKFFDFDTDQPVFVQTGEGFEGTLENPVKDGINSSDSVGLSINSADTESAVIYDLPGYIDFSESFVLSLNVLSDSIGKFRLLLDRRGTNDEPLIMEVPYQNNGEWEKLLFDIRDNVGKKEIGEFYNRISISFDGNDDDQDERWYFDELYGPVIVPVYHASARFELKSEYPEISQYEIEIESLGEKYMMYNDGSHSDEVSGDSIWTCTISEIPSGNHKVNIFADEILTVEGREIPFEVIESPELQIIELKHAIYYPTTVFEIICSNPMVSDFEIILNNSGEKMALFNDGTNGDLVAGDTIWTLITSEIPTGNHTYDIITGGSLIEGGDDISFLLPESSEPQTISFVYKTDVSINDKKIKDFTIFPNPARDVLTISSKKAGINSVKIIDLTGGLVLEENAQGESLINLSLDLLYPGLYFVQLKDSNGQLYTSKFVKK